MSLVTFIWHQIKCVKTKNTDNHTINSVLIQPSTRFVGVAGFEPATSASQTRRDNRATLHPDWLSNIAERRGFEPRVPFWGTTI